MELRSDLPPGSGQLPADVSPHRSWHCTCVPLCRYMYIHAQRPTASCEIDCLCMLPCLGLLCLLPSLTSSSAAAQQRPVQPPSRRVCLSYQPPCQRLRTRAARSQCAWKPYRTHTSMLSKIWCRWVLGAGKLTLQYWDTAQHRVIKHACCEPQALHIFISCYWRRRERPMHSAAHQLPSCRLTSQSCRLRQQ